MGTRRAPNEDLGSHAGEWQADPKSLVDLERFLLASPGARKRPGAVTEEYVLVQVAKYLGCKPWELEEVDEKWIHHGLAYRNLDIKVEEIRIRRARSKGKK